MERIANTPCSGIELFRASDGPGLALPFACQGISCGFPSPADDYIEQAIDLNKVLIKDHESTFFGRVSGQSMINANIHQGDVVIIDRSLKPRNDCIALCLLNGEFTVKRLEISPTRIVLHPANPDYKSTLITPETDFSVWGVVTYVIHKTW